MHSFRAVSDGVLVLDVIGPPYAGDRPCRYYREASEDEITNLALPEIAGSAKLGSRRAGSSDEEVWGERSSKAARLGAAAAASRKSRRAGTSGKRRSKETRERIVKPEVVPTTMDGWIAYMQSQAQGMSGPAPHRPSDPTVGSLGLPPGAVVFTPETSRIDIETSTGSLASLEGQLESWALGMELDPRIDSGVNLDLSTRSLPDARLALGGGSGNIPSGRSQFGPTVTRRPLGGTMGMRANSRQMSRGFSTGGVGPTFWSMEQGNVGTCVWLVEDPAVEYECVEREYVGEAVYLGADAESEGAQSVVEPAEVPVVVVNL